MAPERICASVRAGIQAHRRQQNEAYEGTYGACKRLWDGCREYAICVEQGMKEVLSRCAAAAWNGRRTDYIQGSLAKCAHQKSGGCSAALRCWCWLSYSASLGVSPLSSAGASAAGASSAGASGSTSPESGVSAEASEPEMMLPSISMTVSSGRSWLAVS